MIKRVLTRPRVLVLILFLALAVFAINPNPWHEGAAIRNIAPNSSAAEAGLLQPNPKLHPMSRETIISINNQPIKNAQDFYAIVSTIPADTPLSIETNKAFYSLRTRPLIQETLTNETETVIIPTIVTVNTTINGSVVSVNETINETVTRQKILREVVGVQDLGIQVYDAPTTNLRKGLDLQGGTRVILQPEEQLNPSDFDILIANMQERLNVYGLSDLVIRKASDLLGNSFILVEIPGASEQDVKDLLSKQGKFEAKIGNDTVFSGGDDITRVCRDATCSGIDPQHGCQGGQGNYGCRFRFTISLSPKAAQQQADLTKNLPIEGIGADAYLSEPLRLVLDNQEVDSLNIGADLKGRAVTDIQISGSGVGTTRQEAELNALQNMKRLQTVLITGSLPTKLTIIKSDTISPSLGEQFITNALWIGVASIIAVSSLIYIRYRQLKIVIPMLITIFSELIILLGVAALIGWSLDLAAIAGIIIAIGTGIDHQIVISDEILKGGRAATGNWKDNIKKALFIIMAAYFTTVVAMVPLMFAGAGLLKGFALTTLIGITIGVFITRRAFAAMVQTLLSD